MDTGKSNQSHAPQVTFRERLYNAEARRLEALGLHPRELEQRLRALAQNLGL